jgi:hypothetical protein
VLNGTFRKNVSTNNIEIPLSSLCRGMYLVKMQYNDIEESARINIL